MTALSTSSQLLKFDTPDFNNFDKNIQTDIAYLDFSKAFDIMSYSLLLLKLRSFGINCNLYNWLVNY